MWKNKILSLVIISILVLSTISIITINTVEGTNGTTLYVGGSGPYNFTTIQDAVNYSEDGDTIYVYNGTYYENIIVNKSIKLIGEDKNTTLIDGGGIDNTMKIITDYVTINGFTIRNSKGYKGGYNGKDYAGIFLSSNFNNITNNIIGSNKRNGIFLRDSNNNIISQNTIINNWYDGINSSEKNLTTHSKNNLITQNNIYNNSYWGIGLNRDSNTTITGNDIKYNILGGIGLFFSSNDTIGPNNNISLNELYGIYSVEPQRNTITGNIITYNAACGIAIFSSTNNTIMGNTIANNPNGIRISYISFKDTIYHNNFIDNINQSYDSQLNTWDIGWPIGGNYWSDYTGPDKYGGPYQDIPGSDGIGDYPYHIPGGRNVDLYPLMYPISELSPVCFQGLEPMYTTDYIEVGVFIDPKEAIAGVQFDMDFDPDMLSIDWVAEGNIFSEYDTYFDPGVIDNINGSLKNVVSLITTPGGNTTNQGSIAIVAIRAKAIPGETYLDIYNVVAGRPDGTPIVVYNIDATVTIQYQVDMNGDGHVNILDLIMIGQHWDETGTPGWIPADVNCDGVVNILDMILVGQHWTG